MAQHDRLRNPGPAFLAGRSTTCEPMAREHVVSPTANDEDVVVVEVVRHMAIIAPVCAAGICSRQSVSRKGQLRLLAGYRLPATRYRLPAALGTHPAFTSCAPGMAAPKGGVAGDWNRAGQAHPGEAKGPNVGGRSAPFFCLAAGDCSGSVRRAPDWRRRPAGAEQGGSGLPRRVSTMVTSWIRLKTTQPVSRA
jgi:hypothetical protein